MPSSRASGGAMVMSGNSDTTNHFRGCYEIPISDAMHGMNVKSEEKPLTV